ncbi:hypothetical protein C5167_040767 [Papaver somniferum]|uniref:Uncharacterized protein n=1 Tax=Papaver somniferum TaxID=3469 RepID=A0A4Y7IFZ9_PAPSO|nr:hypothetical protein C5167_040767 [Papaver somniferum]
MPIRDKGQVQTSTGQVPLVASKNFLVGDQHRGYLLELMLTKTRCAAGEGNTESSSGESSAMLLMCKYLMRCPITPGRDIIITGSSSCKGDLVHGLKIVGTTQ